MLGGGDAEDLEEPGVRMVPMGRWVVPVFVVGVIAALLGVLVATLLPWIRPVHLAHDRLHDLFRPALSVDGRAWSEPGDLEPDTFLARFCNGLLLRAVDSADGAVMSTGRGAQPGNALTAVYPDRAGADEAYARLSSGLTNCSMRGSRWVVVEPGEVAEGTVAFRLEPPLQTRGNVQGVRSAGRAHLLLVQYANTVTLFMTPTAPDAAATRAAYQDRVAAVARKQD